MTTPENIVKFDKKIIFFHCKIYRFHIFVEPNREEDTPRVDVGILKKFIRLGTVGVS